MRTPRCSGRWPARCCSSRTRASRSCGWMRSPSSGSGSARRASRCPRRTCCCARSTRCCGWRRPRLLFKSEAIVHPDEVIEYISLEECQLSYNPLQMALTWEALATRDPRLLQQALERRHALPAGHRVGQLRAQPRRHRLDVRRRGCRGARHRRLLPPAVPQRLLRRPRSRAPSRAACRSRRTRRPAMPASPARRRRSPASKRATPAASRPRRPGARDRDVDRRHPAALSRRRGRAAQRLLVRRRPRRRPATAAGCIARARPGGARTRSGRMPRPRAGRVLQRADRADRARQATPEFAGNELIGVRRAASVGARLSATGR